MIGVLEGCQHPSGCRKIATTTVEVVARDGSVADSAELCAGCASEVGAPPGYSLRRTNVADADANPMVGDAR